MESILLVCNAGMSTSLLVTKMKSYAENQGKNVKIEAVSLDAADAYVGNEDVDVVLFGPQVRFSVPQFQEKHPDLKVDVISMQDYGMMNGEKVFQQAEKVVEG